MLIERKKALARGGFT